MQIDGHTRLAAVVANPIKHSISPFIHNSAFEKTQVNGVYVAWEIPESDLAETVENIRRYNMLVSTCRCHIRKQSFLFWMKLVLQLN